METAFALARMPFFLNLQKWSGLAAEAAASSNQPLTKAWSMG